MRPAIVCRARLLDTSSLPFQSLFVKSDCIVVFAIEKTGRAPLTDKEKATPPAHKKYQTTEYGRACAYWSTVDRE